MKAQSMLGAQSISGGGVPGSGPRWNQKEEAPSIDRSGKRLAAQNQTPSYTDEKTGA